MKSLEHYSEEKFSSFSFEQQCHALDKLIHALEQALNNDLERQRLISHILERCKLLQEAMPAKLTLFTDGLHPQLSAHQVLNKLYHYHEEALRKDSQLSIRTGDGSVHADPEVRHKAAQITIICDNLRSVFNIGSLFRSAPSHPNMPKTAMGTQSLVSWQHFTDTKDAISYCKAKNMHIYALETVNEAVSVFKTAYRFPMALVIGNESLGIEPETLELCDAFITLPQLGWKNSLNVGVATTAALYQIIFGAYNG